MKPPMSWHRGKSSVNVVLEAGRVPGCVTCGCGKKHPASVVAATIAAAATGAHAAVWCGLAFALAFGFPLGFGFGDGGRASCSLVFGSQ